MSKLDTALCQTVPTRWNTHLAMLESIEKNFGKVEEALLAASGDESYRMVGINRDTLNILIKFLKPFKTAMDILEASSQPTLHRVIPRLRELLDTLILNRTDPLFLAKLKRISKDYFGKNFVLHQYHRLALFLNPKCRSLKALSNADKLQTLEDVKRMISNVDQDDLSDLYGVSSPLSAEHGYNANGPPAKKTKTGELWEDDEDEVQTTPSMSVIAEIETYKNLPVPADKDLDLLQWWKAHSAQLPRLSNWAKHILCIPASSAPSERNFSTAGLIVDKLRTRLNPKNVDDLLLLRSNWDLIK